MMLSIMLHNRMPGRKWWSLVDKTLIYAEIKATYSSAFIDTSGVRMALEVAFVAVCFALEEFASDGYTFPIFSAPSSFHGAGYFDG